MLALEFYIFQPIRIWLLSMYVQWLNNQLRRIRPLVHQQRAGPSLGDVLDQRFGDLRTWMQHELTTMQPVTAGGYMPVTPDLQPDPLPGGTKGQVIRHLMAHPEDRDMSTRELGEKLGVNHMAVSRAKVWMEENQNTPA